MSLLWTPENTPPQLTPAAAEEVRRQLSLDGVLQHALDELEKEEPLVGFLDEFGFDLNRASDEGAWPSYTLHVTAALTLLAYRTDGVKENIDEQAIETGSFLAELYGIPQTYVEAAYNDPQLVDLNQLILGSQMFDESSADEHSKGGYGQIGVVGSGIARHYLQQAVEMAA